MLKHSKTTLARKHKRSQFHKEQDEDEMTFFQKSFKEKTYMSDHMMVSATERETINSRM